MNEFLLVKDGKPAATIVISASPTKSAAFAVEELQYHIKKITGCTLPVAFDNQRVSGPQILIGESRITAHLGLRNDDLASQEYLIMFYPDTLVIMGKDDRISNSEDKLLPRVEGKFGKLLASMELTVIF